MEGYNFVRDENFLRSLCSNGDFEVAYQLDKEILIDESMIPHKKGGGGGGG